MPCSEPSSRPAPPHSNAAFAMTADPTAYVPRDATERALAALERSVESGAGTTVLLGEVGLGKTLLLRVLAGRLADRFHPVYFPISALPQSEIGAVLLASLNVAACAFPEPELLSIGAQLREVGSALLLLVDDAEAMTVETARGLAGLASASHGGLRIVFAAVDDARGRELLRAVGPQVNEIRLVDPMDVEETGAYLRGRLERLHAAGSNDSWVDARAVARIHGASKGVPRLVHLEAAAFLDGTLRTAPSLGSRAGRSH